MNVIQRVVSLLRYGTESDARVALALEKFDANLRALRAVAEAERKLIHAEPLHSSNTVARI